MNTLALPVGVLLLLVAAWRVSEHRYLLAAAQASLAILAFSWMPQIRRKRPGRALGTIGLGGISIVVLVALAIDWGNERLPGVDVAARIGLAILFAIAAFGQSRRRSTDELPTREELLRDPGMPRRLGVLGAVFLAITVDLVLFGADASDPTASLLLYGAAGLAVLFSAFFWFGFIRSRQQPAG